MACNASKTTLLRAIAVSLDLTNKSYGNEASPQGGSCYVNRCKNCYLNK